MVNADKIRVQGAVGGWGSGDIHRNQKEGKIRL